MATQYSLFQNAPSKFAQQAARIHGTLFQGEMAYSQANSKSAQKITARLLEHAEALGALPPTQKPASPEAQTAFWNDVATIFTTPLYQSDYLLVALHATIRGWCLTKLGQQPVATGINEALLSAENPELSTLVSDTINHSFFGARQSVSVPSAAQYRPH